MLKLIASDLDGTLLLHGAQSLNPEVFDLIKALKKHGITFVAASGRQLASQQNLFQPVADQIDYIAENGSVCSFHGEVFPTTEISRDLSFRVIDAILSLDGCKTVVSCMKSCYILDGDPDFLHHLRYNVHNIVEVVSDFSEITEPILKIAFFTDRDIAARAESLKEKFASEIKVVTSGNDWIDFVPFDANKGTALEIILNRLSIDPKEIMVFGDQQNDIEMLSLAGTSYAMETASDEVKSYATKITSSVEDVLRNILKGM